MKSKSRILALVLVLALMVGGCCEKVGVDGTVTESFSNCLSFSEDVQEFICNPPANVVALAEAAGPFITLGLAAGLPEALPAYQAVVAILSGGMACATIKQVNALIALLSGDQAKKFRAKAIQPSFDTAPLQAWLATAKK